MVEAYCDMALADDDSCPGTNRDSVNDVVYTEDEIDDNDALVVRAKSDGDQQSVNLYLDQRRVFSPANTKVCPIDRR